MGELRFVTTLRYPDAEPSLARTPQTPDADTIARIVADGLNTGEYAEAPVDAAALDQTSVQALALARLIRDRPGQHAQIHTNPFGLPAGYWLVVFDHGFECGIAPNGDVSS